MERVKSIFNESYYYSCKIDEIFSLNFDELNENNRYVFFSLKSLNTNLNLIQVKKLKNKIEEIISNYPIKEKTIITPLDKVVYSYAYILKNVRYHIPECGFGRVMPLSESEAENHVCNAYGALINGKGLCVAMAEAIVLILKHPKFNIRADVVLGENHGIPHEFVKVKLGENIYYLDPAAELGFNPNAKIQNFKSDYFLVSGSKLIEKGYIFERSTRNVRNLKVYIDSENYDRGMIKNSYKKLNKSIEIISRNDLGR